jgi:hypothetical protein
MTTTTGKRRTYELLSKQKSNNATEQHYCSSEIEVSKYQSIVHRPDTSVR